MLEGLGEYSEQARGVAARIQAFEPVGLQSVIASRELCALDPERAAFVLAALLELARFGGERERQAVDAVGRAILSAPPEQLPYVHRDRILAAAEDNDLRPVAALFVAPKAAIGVNQTLRPRADPQIAHLSLGHKKMLARSGSPDLVARLAAEAEPSVVRNILLNPKLTEQMVVRICARRPIRAEALREVFASRKWSTREAVRKAIVLNPFAEPELALKILPTLPEATLKEVARDSNLHPRLREQAAALQRRASPSQGDDSGPELH